MINKKEVFFEILLFCLFTVTCVSCYFYIIQSFCKIISLITCEIHNISQLNRNFIFAIFIMIFRIKTIPYTLRQHNSPNSLSLFNNRGNQYTLSKHKFINYFLVPAMRKIIFRRSQNRFAVRYRLFCKMPNSIREFLMQVMCLSYIFKFITINCIPRRS